MKKNAFSLKKQENIYLSNIYNKNIESLEKQYNEILSPLKEILVKDINKKDDLAVSNFYNPIIKIKDIKITSLFIEMSKNILIDCASQVENEVTSAIVVKSKDKIRETRARRIAKFLYSNLDKNYLVGKELEKIMLSINENLKIEKTRKNTI